MDENAQSPQIDFTVTTDNLYREESITDLKAASIRCLTPVKPDGTEDDSRKKMFVGHTQLMSPQGMVPLHAPLEAETLEEAMEKFPEAMKKALDEMIEQARKMQEQQQSRIQQPGSGASNIIVPGR